MRTGRRLLLALACVAACRASGSRPADSAVIDTARARRSAGDLSGPPTDSAGHAHGPPRRDTVIDSLPTRGDGRATNPPIHRTMPDAAGRIPPAGAR